MDIIMRENELKMLRLIRLCGGINRYKLCQGLAISQADAIDCINRMIENGDIVVGGDPTGTNEKRKQWLYVQDCVQNHA